MAAAAPARSRRANSRKRSPASLGPAAMMLTTNCSWGSTTATTPLPYGCRETPPSSSRRISSRRSSTMPTTGVGSRPPMRLSDVYAMGGTPVVAVNLLGWPRDVLPDGAGSRGAARWSGRRPDGALPSGRWAQHRRSGTEVRAGGDRHRRPGTIVASRRRAQRDAVVVDQTARGRRAQHQAQGDRRTLSAGHRGHDDLESGRVARRRLRPA